MTDHPGELTAAVDVAGDGMGGLQLFAQVMPNISGRMAVPGYSARSGFPALQQSPVTLHWTGPPAGFLLTISIGIPLSPRVCRLHHATATTDAATGKDHLFQCQRFMHVRRSHLSVFRAPD